MITEIAARLPPADAAAARGRALAVLALMTGSLQLARAVTDPRLSQDILDEGIANALTLAGVDTTTRPTFRP